MSGLYTREEEGSRKGEEPRGPKTKLRRFTTESTEGTETKARVPALRGAAFPVGVHCAAKTGLPLAEIADDGAIGTGHKGDDRGVVEEPKNRYGVGDQIDGVDEIEDGGNGHGAGRGWDGIFPFETRAEDAQEKLQGFPAVEEEGMGFAGSARGGVENAGQALLVVEIGLSFSFGLLNGLLDLRRGFGGHGRPLAGLFLYTASGGGMRTRLGGEKA